RRAGPLHPPCDHRHRHQRHQQRQQRRDQFPPPRRRRQCHHQPPAIPCQICRHGGGVIHRRHWFPLAPVIRRRCVRCHKTLLRWCHLRSPPMTPGNALLHVDSLVTVQQN